ncbi:hypothetical protein GGR56DRAFT_454993 [Xylariaceae sp. FL0804]|nr:hypothetical protein GGR56DRAFT_454993 [Xylariaceae sp. FL0804]
MASMIARRAAISGRAFSGRAFSTSTRRLDSTARDPDVAQKEESHSRKELKEETKRNPELMSTSESTVAMARAGMPWETGSTQGKYRYHPGGDTSKPPRDAPSALHETVIPELTLPKYLHDAHNKWGKDLKDL